jgi:hypothetical protein
MLSGASLGYSLAHSADSANPVDAIKVVLAPAGTTPGKVQSSPVPTAGMGGQLLVDQDGAYLAPFSLGGP